MDTTVRIVTRGNNPTPWLEVDYPGLRPPLALFADLEMIGWTPPAIQPPPAAAIDWSTPNPDTGERFTIRDYPVTAAVVTPPAGSGRDGAWSDAEAPAFATVLQGVLARHGVTPADASPLPDRPAPPPPTQQPAPADRGAAGRRRLFGRSSGRGVADEAPAPAAAATRVGPVLPRSRKGEIGTILEATVLPDQRAALDAAAAALGLPYELRVVEARTVESYRASTYETVTPAVQARVVVPPSEEARATAVLADVGLIDPDMVVEPRAEPTEAAPELTPVTPIAARAPLVDPDLATIELCFDPDRRHAVDAALVALALAPVSDETATRTEINSYRGTSYETVVPAVRMVFGVDPAQAPRISTVLAQAARVNPSDATQLAITLPEARAERDAVAPAESRPFLVISAS